MRVKTGKPIRTVSRCGFMIAILLLSFATAMGSEEKKGQPPQPLVMLRGQLKFMLSGEPGEYRELEPVIIKVHQSAGRVRFAASPFLYSGNSAKGRHTLKAVYWVDHPKQRFDSKLPLVLYTGGSNPSKPRDGYFEMRLYGKVTIDQISAQPAGEYGGSIMVTVTERR